MYNSDMRLVVRSVAIAYASIEITQRLIGGLDFGSNNKTLLLVILALILLNIFMIPLFRILSLPHYGFSFMLLNFILTFVIMYVLTILLSSFEAVETTISQLRIFGFVVPSRKLSAISALAFSAFTISVVYHFIEWLFEKR
jgi:hypothetical protein